LGELSICEQEIQGERQVVNEFQRAKSPEWFKLYSMTFNKHDFRGAMTTCD